MRSIRFKLLAFYLILFLLAFSLLSLSFNWILRSYYLNVLRERLAAEAMLTGELVKPLLMRSDYIYNIDLINDYVNILGDKSNARVTLVSPDGVVLGDSTEDLLTMDNHSDRSEIIDALQHGVGFATRHSDTVGVDYFYVAVLIEENGRPIVVMRNSLPMSLLNETLKQIRLTLLVGLLCILGITLYISSKLSYLFIHPLRKMTEAARRIADGELNAEIGYIKEDEFGDLAKAMTIMSKSLKSQLNEIYMHKAQVEAIFTNMADGILVLNESGVIIRANPAAGILFGYDSANMTGRNYVEIIRSYELTKKVNLAFKNHDVLEHELEIHFPEKKLVQIKLSTVKKIADYQPGLLLVMHDITQLRKLEKMRSDFAANASHELRTPLTAIRGFAETLIDEGCQDNSNTLRFVKIIYHEAECLNNLFEDLLKLSEIESGKVKLKYEILNVKLIIEEVISRVKNRLDKYDFKFEYYLNDIQNIYGDKSLLLQAIYNLVDNAIKYTYPGGSIRVRVLQDNDYICIYIKDSGVGIPENAQERVFERFYRVEKARSREQGGTGLGLAIVKHIIEIHRGTLVLESEEGKGTSMLIKLPIHK